MNYTSAEIINPDFYKSFLSVLKTDSGKDVIKKLNWYVNLDGFHSDPYINAYRNGAKDLISLISKWGDESFYKQMKLRKEFYDRTKHESDNERIGEFGGTNKGSNGGTNPIMVR